MFIKRKIHKVNDFVFKLCTYLHNGSLLSLFRSHCPLTHDSKALTREQLSLMVTEKIMIYSITKYLNVKKNLAPKNISNHNDN